MRFVPLQRCVVFCFAVMLFLPYSSGQITQPYSTDPGIVVTPVKPGDGVTATIDVFAQCAAPTGPSLLKSGTQNSVSGGDPVPLILAAPLSAGDSLCAIEMFVGKAAPAPVMFNASVLKVRPAKATAATLKIEPVFTNDPFLSVDAPPVANYMASLNVYSSCPAAAGVVPLQLAGSQNTVGDPGKSVTLVLTTPPKAGDSFCVVESYTPIPPNAIVMADSAPSAAVTAADPAPAPAPKPTPQTDDQLEARDKTIRLEEKNCTLGRSNSCLAALAQEDLDFFNFAAAASSAGTQASAGHLWYGDYLRLKRWNIAGLVPAAVVPAAKPPAVAVPVKIDQACSQFTPQALANAKSGDNVFNQGCFALSLGDLTGHVGHVRAVIGVDVSAASSADPAAKFLFESSLDIPLPAKATTSPIDARTWFWGYFRVGSIAQPGPVSGLANVATDVSTLTAQAPNQIVQSIEATGGYEFRIKTFENIGFARRPVLFSFIASGGLITPISDSQESTTTPPIYIATPALQTYYATQATTTPSTINKENAMNIATACPVGVGNAAAVTCYIVQYAQARDHFFRNYGSGFRLKRYYYNEANESFIYPAVADFTIGQNEYVTGGELHRWVAHFGGSTPIAGIPGLYAYTSFDLVLSKNAVQSQQFALQTAGSAIMTSSANVAQIFVVQPDRDRYRFGVAYDISTLISALAAKLKPGQ